MGKGKFVQFTVGHSHAFVPGVMRGMNSFQNAQV
jgi:hypothetical protein